jgi:hypothetical protein
MTTYFLTFGAGNESYHGAVERLSKQISRFELFDKIISLSEDYLQNDIDFWRKHSNFIQNNKIGFGFWIWKPYIILKQLEKMKEGDTLLYLDCGCEANFYAKEKMSLLLEIVKTKNILLTTSGLPEKEWTKRDILNILDCDKEYIINTYQYQGGIILIVKNDIILKLIKEWYELCCNYNYINNSISTIENYKEFKNHRNDQSVLSLLLKKKGYLNNYDIDPTWFGRSPRFYKIKNIPIIANRNISSKTLISKLDV